jgi:ketosteroid isomerase-like protein
LTHDDHDLTLETISLVATDDMAYELFIQRATMRLGRSERTVPVALRVTSVFRREEAGWKLVHRHADALTECPIEAVGEVADQSP